MRRWLAASVVALAAAAPAMALAGCLPAMAQDSITLPNGQKVRAEAPGGGAGKVNADGSITYPDGTNIGVAADGSTVVRRADGRTSRQPPPDSHTLPNGQEVRATDPSGRRGKVYPDGSIGYPDGTRVRMGADGSTEIVGPDGRVRSREAPPKGEAGGGVPTDGDGYYTLGNGQRVRNTGADGGMGTMMPDGSIRYPDGSTASVAPNGDTIITRPDGRVQRYPAPGRGEGGSGTASAGAGEGRGEAEPGERDDTVADMNAASERMKARGLEIVRLEMQADNCPKGSAGKLCREGLRARIRALQQANKEDALATAERLKLVR